MPAPEPKPLGVHKALADDTRFRLHRYLGLSGRPVSVRGGPAGRARPVRVIVTILLVNGSVSGPGTAWP